MKAVFFEQRGDADVLKYGEFPTPKPAEGEALIRVKACALNRLDLWLRQRYEIELPHIPGSDVSGIIEELHGASSLQVRQEVVINPALPCGQCPRCRHGKSCELVIILGAKNQGGYAEYMTVPIKQVYPKPVNLSLIEAAGFPLTFLTAWHMLSTRVRLHKDETVFIWGASGGLGVAAVQVAKLLGGRVIAAAKGVQLIPKLKALGADEVVVYTAGNVLSSVKKLTGDHGVDVVFESVGQKTWRTSLDMLRPYGRLVIAGATSGERGSVDLGDLYVRQLTILGARMGTKEEFETVLSLVASGVLKPVIDTVFPLREAARAQQRMESGAHFGKIVLELEA